MLSISAKKVTHIPDFPHVPAVRQKIKIRCNKKSGETNWCRLAVGSGRFLSLPPHIIFILPSPRCPEQKRGDDGSRQYLNFFREIRACPRFPWKRKTNVYYTTTTNDPRQEENRFLQRAVSLYLFVLSGKSSKFLLFSPLSPLNNVANSTRWWWRKEGENPLNRVEKSLKCVWTF